MEPQLATPDPVPEAHPEPIDHGTPGDSAGARPTVSYAQNFEDVVLWRALRHVPRGTYVDVGAADPTVNSISRLFYENGWRGVNVEPVPSLAAALQRHRPEDITVAVAAGAKAGFARLFAAESTGNSTLIPELAEDVVAQGVVVLELTVPVVPLDQLLEGSGVGTRDIHFCTIDVEGSEADVLDGFDLKRWRPWILVIEATKPNRTEASHDSWEPRVLAAGYRFCLFDGLNRFYVHEDRLELTDALSYPACVFDEPFERAVDASRQFPVLQVEAAGIAADRDNLRRDLAHLDRENRQLSHALAESHDEMVRWRGQSLQTEGTGAELAALEQENALLRDQERKLMTIESTVSWRVTRPLRALRRVQLQRSQPQRAPVDRPDGAERALRTSPQLRDALGRRLLQAAATLTGDPAIEGLDVSDAHAVFEAALRDSAVPTRAKAWLALVAADGSYPDKPTVDRTARLLRMEGPRAVTGEVLRRFASSAEAGRRSTAGLDVVREGTVIDVSHTVSHDLHTGIQRVVRETISRWLEDGHAVQLVNFDAGALCPRRLSEGESRRILSWRDHLSASGSDVTRRAPKEATGDVLVPWRCRLILPELVAEPHRCESYRALASSAVLQSLSLIGYDLIPMTAAETVTEGMTANFGQYLSMVKYADRVAAISQATARDFTAFTQMTTSQGLPGPEVAAFPLPTEVPPLPPDRLESARATLGIGTTPLILVVGSHEPRKNHVAVLEAAERMWTEGDRFELLMIGGSGWRSDEFDEVVAELTSAGRPIKVRKRSTETELWAAYHLARFTVFPSLLEGFGLPVAESLACGTPVITSNYGSMAEIAELGGSVLVDPLDIDALHREMARLLHDDEVLNHLRQEAEARPAQTWNAYAADLWRFFAETSTS